MAEGYGFSSNGCRGGKEESQGTPRRTAPRPGVFPPPAALHQRVVASLVVVVGAGGAGTERLLHVGWTLTGWFCM